MKILILITAMLVFITLAVKSAVSSISYPPSGIRLPEVKIYGSKVVPNTTAFSSTGWQPQQGC